MASMMVEMGAARGAVDISTCGRLRLAGRLVAGLVAVSVVAGCSAGGVGEGASQEDIASQSNEVTAPTSLLINAGGVSVTPFLADQSFTGGKTISHANAIDTSGVTGAAPAAVYQTARTGNFSYTLSGFAPGVARTVRLHFAETFFSKAGSRVFNVSINGAAVLDHFDVFASAGAKNRAYIAEFSKPADSTGAFVIQFKNVKDASLVSAIEIPAPSTPPPPPGGSAGCGITPSTDTSTGFTAHDVAVAGVAPIYQTGGQLAQVSGPYDFTHRVYSVRLPTNYDPSKAYPVTLGGGGCGGNSVGFAANPGGGFVVAPAGESIQVGLMYVNGCFSDGGPTINNRADTPELPYLKSVLADVEGRLCVDTKRVFMSGFSSGANDAFVLGCAAADSIRGVSSVSGVMRAVRPACTGPEASFMVVGEADTANPVGPLAPTDSRYAQLGSAGSAPGRDDYLLRNGCAGSASAPWDPAYPACVKYTACPAAYPVVWCSLPGVGHDGSVLNGVSYSPAGAWKFLSSLPVQ